MRTTRVIAYRLTEETFAPDPEVGGYWLSREPVEPVEVADLGDLVERHARAGIEFRAVPEPLAGLESHRRLDARVQRDPAPQRGATALGERPLLRDPWAPREAGRRRANLAQHH